MLGPARAARARSRATSRGSPSAPPSARRWSTRCTSPSATRCAPRSSRGRSAIDGVDLVMWLERDAHERPARGRDREPRGAASCASRPGGELQDPRGARWSVEGALAVLGGRRRGRALLQTPDYPDALARVLVGAHVPHLGRGAAVGRAGLRVPRLGPPGARRRRQPRLAARQRLARRARRSAGSRCPTPEPAQWAIRDVAPLVLEHFGVRLADLSARYPRVMRRHGRPLRRSPARARTLLCRA